MSKAMQLSKSATLQAALSGSRRVVAAILQYKVSQNSGLSIIYSGTVRCDDGDATPLNSCLPAFGASSCPGFVLATVA
ncbi:hypothetical protein RA28_19735 [Ruegeria sp. ANG-S4]|nr:hypothetical protein RA28_19735 [Ruegeria sp. ANG-S4]